MCGNRKLDKCRDLIDELGEDIVAINEHRQNVKHKDNCNGWTSSLREGRRTSDRW
jgi:hypothetical protein